MSDLSKMQNRQKSGPGSRASGKPLTPSIGSPLGMKLLAFILRRFPLRVAYAFALIPVLWGEKGRKGINPCFLGSKSGILGSG